MSKARKTQRGEHERGFPRLSSPRRNNVLVSIIHTDMHIHTNRHTEIQKKLTSIINLGSTKISLHVCYVLQRAGEQMPPYMEQQGGELSQSTHSEEV